MLLVNAKAGPSGIHGTGLIAQEFIPKGTKVWRFMPEFDVLIPEAKLKGLSVESRAQVLYYAYFHLSTRTFVLSSDDDRFTKHSNEPNTRPAGDCTVAVRDIQPGEGITNDYGELASLNFSQTNNHSVYVSRCAIGFGLFAGRDFKQGEMLFRFTGPIINLAESIAQGDGENNHLQIGPKTYIDTEPPCVFANHSCDPNVGIRHDTQAYALRAIRLGEEVRFDYSTTTSERRWIMHCRCGSPSCRGIIGDFHDLPEKLQQHYIALGIVQAFIVQEVELASISRPGTHSTLSGVMGSINNYETAARK